MNYKIVWFKKCDFCNHKHITSAQDKFTGFVSCYRCKKY